MDVSDNDRTMIVGTCLQVSIYAFSMHNIKKCPCIILYSVLHHIYSVHASYSAHAS